MFREREQERTSQGDEGWSVVRRKQKVMPARRVEDAGGAQGGEGRKMKHRAREDFVSIFVDNLPDFADNTFLRRIFAEHGRVRDVFVPWRWRPKLNVRYGFVRFETFKEAECAIFYMNGRVVEGRNIIVHLVQDGLQQRDSSRLQPAPKVGRVDTKAHGGSEVSRDNRKYAEVVAGKPEGSNPVKQKEGMLQSGGSRQYEGAEINKGRRLVVKGKRVGEDVNSISSFIGKIKCCKDIFVTSKWFKEKANMEVEVTCLGGHFIRITSVEGVNMTEGLAGGWPWLEEWFYFTQKWDPFFSSAFRTVWLICVGLPASTWCYDTLKNIGELWGEVIEVEEEVMDGISLEEGRVLIVTDVSRIINDFIEVVVDGQTRVVWVREDSSKVSLNNYKKSDMEIKEGGISLEQEYDKCCDGAMLVKKISGLRKQVRKVKKRIGALQKILDKCVLLKEDYEESEMKTSEAKNGEDTREVEKEVEVGREGTSSGSNRVEESPYSHVSASADVVMGVPLLVDSEYREVGESFELGRSIGPVQVVNSFEDLINVTMPGAPVRILPSYKKRRLRKSYSQVYQINDISMKSKVARRRRKRLGEDVRSADDANVESSRSDSIESVSEEFLEAARIVDTTKKIGVSFNHNESEVLERCIVMEKRNVEANKGKDVS